MYSEKDYRKILNLYGEYTLESLKKAYHNAVKINHPDKFKNPINKKLATEKMKLINEAYEYFKRNVNNQTFNSKSESSNNSYDNKQKSNTNQKTNTNNENKNNKSSNQDEKTSKEKQEDNDILKDLEFYIKNNKKIRIEYEFKTGKTATLDILPKELVYGLYGQEAMYLKALYLAQNSIKTYRADRILKVSALEEENRHSEYEYQGDNNETSNSFKETKKDIWNLIILLPIITAIVIIISFFKVPYTVYMLLRVLVCLTLLNTILTLRKFIPIFAILLCIGGIILYNPIYPVHLTRSIWQVFNVAVLITIVQFLNGYFRDE